MIVLTIYNWFTLRKADHVPICVQRLRFSEKEAGLPPDWNLETLLEFPADSLLHGVHTCRSLHHVSHSHKLNHARFLYRGPPCSVFLENPDEHIDQAGSQSHVHRVVICDLGHTS